MPLLLMSKTLQIKDTIKLLVTLH